MLNFFYQNFAKLLTHPSVIYIYIYIYIYIFKYIYIYIWCVCLFRFYIKFFPPQNSFLSNLLYIETMVLIFSFWIQLISIFGCKKCLLKKKNWLEEKIRLKMNNCFIYFLFYIFNKLFFFFFFFFNKWLFCW